MLTGCMASQSDRERKRERESECVCLYFHTMLPVGKLWWWRWCWWRWCLLIWLGWQHTFTFFLQILCVTFCTRFPSFFLFSYFLRHYVRLLFAYIVKGILSTCKLAAAWVTCTSTYGFTCYIFPTLLMFSWVFFSCLPFSLNLLSLLRH